MLCIWVATKLSVVRPMTNSSYIVGMPLELLVVASTQYCKFSLLWPWQWAQSVTLAVSSASSAHTLPPWTRHLHSCTRTWKALPWQSLQKWFFANALGKACYRLGIRPNCMLSTYNLVVTQHALWPYSWPVPCFEGPMAWHVYASQFCSSSTFRTA